MAVILKAIRDHVIASDMDFGEQKTAGGIIIMSDDGKSLGVKPRWARVYSVGPEQKDIAVGEWILVEHGRWTRGFDAEDDDGTKITLRKIDTDAILLASDEKPGDAYVAKD